MGYRRRIVRSVYADPGCASTSPIRTVGENPTGLVNAAELAYSILVFWSVSDALETLSARSRPSSDVAAKTKPALCTFLSHQSQPMSSSRFSSLSGDYLADSVPDSKWLRKPKLLCARDRSAISTHRRQVSDAVTLRPFPVHSCSIRR